MKKVSPHWPGIGKYIGSVTDGGLNIDRAYWQSRRVYSDELRILNIPNLRLKGWGMSEIERIVRIMKQCQD